MQVIMKEEEVVFKFGKRMDLLTVARFENMILEQISETSRVVFDLIDVEYIGTHFINLCRKISNLIGIDNFLIKGAKNHINDLFLISGGREIFSNFDMGYGVYGTREIVMM